MSRLTLILVLVFSGVSLIASAADAALARFDVRNSNFTQQSNVSPNPEYRTSPNIGVVVIDNDGGSGSPVMKRWVTDLHLAAPGTGTTVDAPALSGFAWFKGRTDEFITTPQTGTGDVSSVIDWGDTTGWTITGGNFCHSVPSYLCDRADRDNDMTVPAPLVSTHFDMHSFIFHGTGFTMSGGRIVFTGGTAGPELGNTQVFYRGAWNPRNGAVPALPLLAIGGVGASILGMGIASVRRKRR